MKRSWFLCRSSLASVLFLSLPFAVMAQPRPKPQALELLHRAALPPSRTVATDIRWAGKDSVYVSWDGDGVSEVGLDGAWRRMLVPDLKTLGQLQHYRHLAVSPTTLVVASVNWKTAWRPLSPKPGGDVFFHFQEVVQTIDLDVQGGKIVQLGLTDRDQPSKPKNEVGWLGTIGERLDWKPILLDTGGPDAPNFFNCGIWKIGAARFLADGSFVLAPGFQDGVHLYDPTGRLVRTWSNEQLGIDSHLGCRDMSGAEEERLRMQVPVFQKRLNSRHYLDEILPLPQGPGLLIRSWGPDQKAHWTLKVLQARGITTYELPVTGERPFDRLHGDVREGKIVLLLSGSGFPVSRNPMDLSSELLVLRMPGM